MIGTHNSCTGEKGKGLLSFLLTPFAKCQSKTIREQYEAGCRFFDVRVKIKDGSFIVAHGPWVCTKNLYTVLSEIDSFPNKCWVGLMYEGSFDNELWVSICSVIARRYTNIDFAWCMTKKPLKVLCINPSFPEFSEEYVGISKQNRNRWMPIPLFWKLKMFNSQRPDPNSSNVTIVDFL